MRNKLWTLSRPLLTIGFSLAVIACSPAESGHDHQHEAAGQQNPVADAVSQIEKLPEADESQSTTNAVRSADSHVHGGAVLSVVSENNTIFMELETPLYNLLGFEYEPKTSEEETHVSDVETRLSKPQNLIRFNADANCTYDTLENRVTLFETHMDEDEAQSDHGHDDDHIEHGEENHDDDHDDADHDADHKDVILKYGLRCISPNKLKNIEVLFFDDFPFFTALELVYLGPSQQMSADLSPSRTKVDLTR